MEWRTLYSTVSGYGQVAGSGETWKEPSCRKMRVIFSLAAELFASQKLLLINRQSSAEYQ